MNSEGGVEIAFEPFYDGPILIGHLEPSTINPTEVEITKILLTIHKIKCEKYGEKSFKCGSSL